MANQFTRRAFLHGASAAGVGLTGMAGQAARAAAPATYQGGVSRWPICLNTSTIRPTPFEEKIQIAHEAGYDGIEVWVNELEAYEKEVGDLKALGARIRDMGMFVPNVIGLWNCMPDTMEAWEESLVATRERLRMAAAVGSRHVAAIPTPDRADFDLKWGADRYRDLVRIGRDDYGISVAVEFVGFLKGVHRFGQACAIAFDADVPEACVIMDTFHLYRGGSGFEGIRHVRGDLIADFHWNDVPAEPPREQLEDKHRVYPGDGILPLKHVLNLLTEIGYNGPLSIETFNEEHYKQDPRVVAKTALDKTVAIIAS